jgi:GntR family galactonate operon transcriptional repressor
MASALKASAPLRQKVVLELTRRIVQGELPPGTLLPAEPRLCEEFGVSRIVVREGVKVLEEKGLLEVRQGRGTTVTPPGRWNPLDPLVLGLRKGSQGFLAVQAELLEARKIFEVEIAGLAALRASADMLGGINHHLRRMDQLTQQPDLFHRADAQFHFLLVEAAQNSVLARLIEPIHGILTLGFRITARRPGVPQRAQVMHWAIFRGLENRDPQQTRQAMRDHLGVAEDDLNLVGAWWSQSDLME